MVCLGYEEKIKVDLYNTPSRKTSKKKEVNIKESTIRETKADGITLPKDTSDYAFDDELIIEGIAQDPFKLETLKENELELLNSEEVQKKELSNVNTKNDNIKVKEHHSFKVNPSIRKSKKTADGNKKYKSQKAIRRSNKIKLQKNKEEDEEIVQFLMKSQIELKPIQTEYTEVDEMQNGCTDQCFGDVLFYSDLKRLSHPENQSKVSAKKKYINKFCK